MFTCPRIRPINDNHCSSSGRLLLPLDPNSIHQALLAGRSSLPASKSQAVAAGVGKQAPQRFSAGLQPHCGRETSVSHHKGLPPVLA